MCWVMPPASPAATSVSRIASSSDVLPWSTWPMIVTTGGRSLEVLVGVLELRLGVDLVGGVDDLDLLVELVGEDLDRVVGQRLGERRHLAELHQLLDDLGHRHAEVLGDVLDRRAGVDPDGVGLQRRVASCGTGSVVGAAPAATAAARRAALGTAARAAGTAARALRGARPASRSRRGARRRPAPGARSPWSEERVGRRALPSARRRRPARRRLAPSAASASGAAARRSRLRASAGRPRCWRWLRLLGAVRAELRLAGQRAVRGVLVDRGGGGLDLDAGSGQPLQHLGGGHVVLLG